MASKLSARQRASLARAARAGRDEWIRSQSAGERVTLASLHTRGLLERRAWRGDGVSRDSAFEYRLAPAVRAELERRGR